MGILEEIANPGPNSYLEALKVYDSIETNRNTRRLAEIQAGLTLQKMQTARQAQQQQAQGYQTIADFMRPQTGGNITPREQSNVVPEAERKNLIVQNPNQPTYMMQGAQNAPSPAETTIPGETPAQPTFMQQGAAGQPSPQTDIIPQMSEAIYTIPTDEIKTHDFTSLGLKLMENPQMTEIAKTFIDMGTKAKEFVTKQTADEKADAEALYTQYGNTQYEVAKLEDQGRIEDARKLYNQNMDFILNDPRFMDNEKAQAFFNSIKDYKPGYGKFFYATTMGGKNIREQQQKQIELMQKGEAGPKGSSKDERLLATLRDAQLTIDSGQDLTPSQKIDALHAEWVLTQPKLQTSPDGKIYQVDRPPLPWKYTDYLKGTKTTPTTKEPTSQKISLTPLTEKESIIRTRETVDNAFTKIESIVSLLNQAKAEGENVTGIVGSAKANFGGYARQAGIPVSDKSEELSKKFKWLQTQLTEPLLNEKKVTDAERAKVEQLVGGVTSAQDEVSMRNSLKELAQYLLYIDNSLKERQ
jgi:hypothetical protein